MEEKREKNYRLINMEDVEAREVNWLGIPAFLLESKLLYKAIQERERPLLFCILRRFS